MGKIELFFLYLCFLLLYSFIKKVYLSKMSFKFIKNDKFISNNDLLMIKGEKFVKYLNQQSTIVFNLLMRQSNDEFDNLLEQANLLVYSGNAGNAGCSSGCSSSSATRNEAELLWHFAQTINKLPM